MTVLEDIRKNIDTTPLYAVVGATDLAVEKAREARADLDKARADLAKRAEAARADLDKAPATVQARAIAVADQVKELPALALNQGMVYSGKVAEGYADLATRGKGFVKRVRTQKATQDLVAQAETTLAQAKGAVTTARKAANDIERSAKATITTGRHEAAKVANVLTDSVVEEAKTAETEVKKSAKRTRSAAKRTTTTAKKATKRTTASAKAATTSAKKTAVAAEKAVETTAEKIGD
jgi:hypothetical protein